MNMTLEHVLSKSVKRIAALHPIVASKAELVVRKSYAEGINIIIVQGLRSMAEQAALYAQGRTTPGAIVTNAKAGSSYHNYGLAFDYALLAPNGIDVLWTVNDQWKRVAIIGKSLGFAWGGDWTSFKDYPHLEMTFGLSVNDLQNGKKPPIEKEGIKVPTIVKERVYAADGVLKRCDGDYKTKATDVRHIKFEKDTYTLKLVWAKGKTVTQLVKEHSADYAFNFPFFHESTLDPIADCKIGNMILNQGYDNQSTWHGFAFKDGQPRIGELSIDDNFGPDGFLVKTTPFLLNDNRAVWDWYREQEGTAADIGKDANGNYVRAQRTIVGLDAQGNLHLAVADGRTGYDQGLTLEEECLFMQSKGCIVALNGDGGGSSVIADKTGSLGQNKGSGERKVNHAVLVFLNPPDAVKTKPVEKDWKQEIHDRAKAEKIITDDWSKKLDEPAPVWMVLATVLKAKK